MYVNMSSMCCFICPNCWFLQLEKARTDAYELAQKGGLGERLQERLVQRAKEEYSGSSWLQEWWNKYSYLEYREPVVVYVMEGEEHISKILFLVFWFFGFDFAVGESDVNSPVDVPF